MLNINGVNNLGVQPGQIGTPQSADPISKNLQEQIDYLKEQIKELSANDTLGWEEKQKKQQELQMQINDLTAQLRQHQIEQKKEKLQEAGGIKENENSEQKSMQSLLSADSAMDHAKLQGNVSHRLEGRAKVLKSEIALDTGRQVSSEEKMQELQDVQQRALNASSSQMRLLGKAGKILNEETEDKTDKLKEETSSSLLNNAKEEESEKSEVITYTQDGKPSPEETTHKITVRA